MKLLMIYADRFAYKTSKKTLEIVEVGYFLDLDLKAPGKSLARVFKEF